ncbi:hypothetical protein K438DRAFT_798871 [Mycena galopus ATCC 62051]|nr:hypothetical protein K438DRAFT_798871 [Mycena galopus ATCC 62051]
MLANASYCDQCSLRLFTNAYAFAVRSSLTADQRAHRLRLRRVFREFPSIERVGRRPSQRPAAASPRMGPSISSMRSGGCVFRVRIIYCFVLSILICFVLRGFSVLRHLTPCFVPFDTPSPCRYLFPSVYPSNSLFRLSPSYVVMFLIFSALISFPRFRFDADDAFQAATARVQNRQGGRRVSRAVTAGGSRKAGTQAGTAMGRVRTLSFFLHPFLYPRSLPPFLFSAHNYFHQLVF